jgi:hypothetical protein
MPWIVAGGMVLGGALGFLGSKSAASAADRAAEMQAKAAQDQVDLGRDTLDWNKDQYAKWEERFDPVFDSMMEELDADLDPNYEAIAGDVKSGFQSARGQERRNLMRYGVRPQDGSFGKNEREYGIREAAAHVGTRSEARESKRGLKYNRLASVTGMGYGIQPSVLGGVNQAGGTLGRAYGSQANMFGQQSSMYSNEAYNSAAGIGNFVGSMPWGEMWNSTKGWIAQRNAPATTGATVAGSGGQTPQQFYGVANSDIRLKDNIKYVGEIQAHKVYTWDWNEIAVSRGVTDAPFGVIAQEVPEEYVTLVDGYLMVDYGRLFGDES